MTDPTDPRSTPAAVHNVWFGDEQSSSDMPLSLQILDGVGELDSFLAFVTSQGDNLLLELDDGRTLILDRRELLARA